MIVNWIFTEISNFLAVGGWVVWLILATSFMLLVLIVERFYFALFGFRQLKKSMSEKWTSRSETHSWAAQQIRQQLLSQAHSELHSTQPYIKMLIMICPLLGLLGTVSGMIEVFDVLAITGTGNARAMASGISKATVPTMAGMMIAIMGLFFQSRLEVFIKKCDQQLANLLSFDMKKNT